MVDGSFIQWDMASSWDNSDWLSEFAVLKEAGMHYVVISTCSTTRGTVTKTIYNTHYPEFEMENIPHDIVDYCLRNAQKTGMKVFLGIHFNEDWWKKSTKDSTWLYSQMEIGNKVAYELYHNYYPKYKNAFFGWYWVYEVDNGRFRTKKHFAMLANALNINLDFMEKHHIRLPIMLSPYMNFLLSTARGYAKNWSYVFNNTNLKKGDIFCPQDCIGGGGLRLRHLDHWFKELKKAVDAKPGLLFWGNVENFDHKNWSSAPLKRFIKQLRIESKYVSNFITFAYSHYYSPNNIDPGYHQMYLKYVKNGHLPNLTPSPPVNVKVVHKNNENIITWNHPNDTAGICGYHVYRNHKKMFTTRVQRKYGENGTGPVTMFIDKPVLSSLFKYEYYVQSYNFVGNVSKLVKAKTMSST